MRSPYIVSALAAHEHSTRVRRPDPAVIASFVPTGVAWYWHRLNEARRSR